MQTSKSTPAPVIPQGLSPHQAAAARNAYWQAYYSVRPSDSSEPIARRVAERAVADYVTRIRNPYREEI